MGDVNVKGKRVLLELRSRWYEGLQAPVSIKLKAEARRTNDGTFAGAAFLGGEAFFPFDLGASPSEVTFAALALRSWLST